MLMTSPKPPVCTSDSDFGVIYSFSPVGLPADCMEELLECFWTICFTNYKGCRQAQAAWSTGKRLGTESQGYLEAAMAQVFLNKEHIYTKGIAHAFGDAIQFESLPSTPWHQVFWAHRVERFPLLQPLLLIGCITTVSSLCFKASHAQHLFFKSEEEDRKTCLLSSLFRPAMGMHWAEQQLSRAPQICIWTISTRAAAYAGIHFRAGQASAASAQISP